MASGRISRMNFIGVQASPCGAYVVDLNLIDGNLTRFIAGEKRGNGTQEQLRNE